MCVISKRRQRRGAGALGLSSNEIKTTKAAVRRNTRTSCPFILSLSTTALSPSACTRGDSRGAHGGDTRDMWRVSYSGTKTEMGRKKCVSAERA